jgi:hypothetical protein
MDKMKNMMSLNFLTELALNMKDMKNTKKKSLMEKNMQMKALTCRTYHIMKEKSQWHKVVI